ncbi:putative neprosin activation peptide [Lupinus albus]|uniref:Putative neprosin activation peptide n=1 Tax=Lupinus albus TaxID=3870 RepID=A0A6A4P7T0_LUPAL|nr:putative neprosin activation peptide [Lupinus albus]
MYYNYTLNDCSSILFDLFYYNPLLYYYLQTKFGDIIDCVDIKKQPAFYHPLLKNHKLQVLPCIHSDDFFVSS